MRDYDESVQSLHNGVEESALMEGYKERLDGRSRNVESTGIDQWLEYAGLFDDNSRYHQTRS